MYALEVTPITSSLLKESLTYFSKTNVIPGTLVTIPLRKSEIRGIVLSSSSVQNIKQNLRHQNFKIRNISQVHDEVLFSPAYLKTVAQLKNYYLVNTGKLIDITYPRAIIKNLADFARTTPMQNEPASLDDSTTETLLQKPYIERIAAYAELAQKHLQNNESLQILCPTVHQVKKIAVDLETLNIDVYPLHGKTNLKKITEIYQTSQQNPVIIISTASFIDIPAYAKTTLVIEQDSSSYYTRAVAPVIDMRIYAQTYARHAGLHLVFADTILRPLRYLNKKQTGIKKLFPEGKIKIISAQEKITQKRTDTERIKDLSERKPFSPLSKKIIEHIKISLEQHEKVFFYVPKKSLAPTIVCRDCGSLAMDSETDTPYSLYIKKNPETGIQERIFINKTNDTQIPAYDVCQYCDSWQLQSMGIGTSSVAKVLEQEFPENTILICDSFHTKTQTELEAVLAEFNLHAEHKKGIIMVGTQKALPYLENIDSTYIVSLESIFARMSYIADMQALGLIANLAEVSKKQVYIQTRNILEKSLPILEYNNLNRFITESLEQAQQSNIHPYGTTLSVHHIFNKDDYQKLYQLYSERLAPWTPYIQTRPSYKKRQREMTILLHLDKTSWNIDSQDMRLSEKLPFEERNIHIEINPEVF